MTQLSRFGMSLYNKPAATHLRIKQKVWLLAGKNERAMAKDQPKQVYTIDQLLDGRNNALFEEVNAAAPVQLVPSTNGEWGGVLNASGHTSKVETIPDDHPGPAFAHELLHIKLEIAGLVKPSVLLNCPGQYEGSVLQFCNDLAHHKMYPLFTAMGYDADEFLGSADDGVQGFIDRALGDLKKLKKAESSTLKVLLLGVYFGINNPHDTKAANRENLIAVVGQQTVAELDQVLNEWKEGNPMDFSPYLALMLRICGITGWGFGKDQQHVHTA